MEFRQLRYFVAVAEERNFGSAARRLNISQPPISRQIHALERELSALLFVRTPKGVELTEAGTVFLEEARRLLAQERRARERSRAAQRGELGTLDVGFFGSTIFNAVPQVLRHFQRMKPGIRITLRRMEKARQIEAIREGALHVGFGRYYPSEPGITIEQVENEDLFVATHHEDAGLHTSESTLHGIADRPLILFPMGGRPSFADEIVGLFKAEGIEPHVSGETEDITTALALVSIGQGVALVPRCVAALAWPSLVFVPLAGRKVTSPINCIYRRGDTSPVLRAFLDALKTRTGRAPAS